MYLWSLFIILMHQKKNLTDPKHLNISLCYFTEKTGKKKTQTNHNSNSNCTLTAHYLQRGISCDAEIGANFSVAFISTINSSQIHSRLPFYKSNTTQNAAFMKMNECTEWC